jgi:hypothetical protein
LPALFYAQRESCSNPGAWLEGAAKTLSELATAAPLVPMAIAAPPESVEAFRSASLHSRLAALLWEGLVPVEGMDESGLAARLKSAGARVPPAVVQRLATNGASEELADAFAEAARSVHEGSAADNDSARSAAERFLFELLDSLPQTAGQFALNRPLEFRHGNAPAEADLVAPAYRLVIELDGSHYHLADPVAYRRDRQKDWQYQRHGYLVLRFLSEDVVAQLEEILETILTAVAHCRHHSSHGGTSP